LKRFAYIDALRGYAILSVMLGHIAAAAQSAVAAQIFAVGPRGVQLFYVVSAVTLMFAWRAHDNGTAAFFVRRAFRIVPMLWVAILATFAVNQLIGKTTASLEQITATALLAHGFSPHWNNSAVAGSWSVAVEAGFYVCFPLIVTVVTNVRRATALLVVSFVVAAACWLPIIHYATQLGVSPYDARTFAFMTFPSQAPCFAVGVLAYFLIASAKRIDSHALTLCGIGAIIVILTLRILIPRDVLIYVFAAGFGVISVALSRGALKLLVNRPICFLGKISYSAYFWHFMVLDVLTYANGSWSFATLAAATLPITVVLSTASYVLVERPMIDLGSVLGKRLSASDQVPLAT
jgi:peptidoglycan/LPS O-acetylase OafA/YrhL